MKWEEYTASLSHLNESGTETNVASTLSGMMSIQWGGEMMPLVSLKCITGNEVVRRCMCVRSIYI